MVNDKWCNETCDYDWHWNSKRECWISEDGNRAAALSWKYCPYCGAEKPLNFQPVTKYIPILVGDSLLRVAPEKELELRVDVRRLKIVGDHFEEA